MNECYVPLISGAISGFIEVPTTHPLDLIKTKLQQESQLGNKVNIIKLAKNIYISQGISGFYIGIVPRIIGVVPMRLTYWSTQYYSTNYFLNNNINLYQSVLCGGIIGGICQTTLDNPLEVVKTRMITSNTNFLQSIKPPYPGFYITLARNSIFAVTVNMAIANKKENKPIYNFMLGATGGFLGSIISQPLDYIKTEVQRSISKQNSNIYEILNNNPSILMKGWYPRAFLGFMNMGIGSFVFINMNNILRKN